MKKFLLSINLLFILLLSSCTTVTQPNTIEITQDDIQIEEIVLSQGDECRLDSEQSSEVALKVIWESSNPEIVSVDSFGNLTINGQGTAIITAYLKDYPYISDSIIVNAKSKVEQLGVGSGLSPEDPIFLGNEGEEEPLEIYFLEMQHIYADSLFIKKGNVEILIDAGWEYDGNYVQKVLAQYCTDDRLDLLMATHSDGDHIDGLTNALRNIDNVSLMIDYGGSGSGNTLSARNKYLKSGMVYHSAYDCVNGLNGATDVYYLTEDFYFEVLNTGNYITSSKASAGNGNSVAVIFYYKDFSFFTAGDLTIESESDLLDLEDLPEVTLYKASHHGSHGSNSQELLDTLNPQAVAISAARAGQFNKQPGGPSENNTYNLNGASGHPAAEAISRIYKAPNISQNLNVYWNAVNGTMKFVTYGTNSFEFYGSETIRGYYDLTLTGGTAKWNAELQDFENKVKGEENFKLHESKVFIFRNYVQYLPKWAQEEYFK